VSGNDHKIILYTLTPEEKTNQKLDFFAEPLSSDNYINNCMDIKI
jgi:hypothetical protein